MGQTLHAVDVAGPARWRWVLTSASGRVLGDHQVSLDTDGAEYEAFRDLRSYLRRQRLPHDPVGSETEAVRRLGTWIGSEVFGRLGEQLSGTVRVVVPREAEFLLSRPLELARVNGVVLARRQVCPVYELPGVASPGDKEPVGESLRILALFSMPSRTSVLDLRRERRELETTVRRIASRSRKAIELRVLQYGVTRERLAEAAEEFPGWDVLHVAGHGRAAALLLERADGEPDPVSTGELIELLSPARDRLKLAVLSVCDSGAAMAAGTLHTLGLHDAADQVEQDEAQSEGGPGGGRVGLARGLVTELGVAALAMRYPVADGFAVALTGELYPRLLGAGQPVDRAVALALPRAVGEQPSAGRPAASIGTPALFGASAAGLRLAPPPGRVTLDPYAERMAWFPPEPERFVGRSKVLVESSTALAPDSGLAGVLFTGMVGTGKTACALELAHQHRSRFAALAWWQAPTTPDEFHGALGGFAEAMETQLDLPMRQAVASEQALRRFLPRLSALLRENAVLLVLDHLDTLLSQAGTWRDPMWGLLMEALLGHGGLSRTVLTSRTAPADAGHAGVLTLPVHPLSAAEAVLLARELPHLSLMLRDVSGTERAGVHDVGTRALARRVLTITQGHPTLLRLADAAAAEPARLSAALAAAETAGPQAPLTAFFTTGGSDLDGGHFVRLLAVWSDAVLAGLPAPARTLAGLLSRIESDHRRPWVVDEVWPMIYKVRHGADAPPLDEALQPLLATALVEYEPAASGDSGALSHYRLHPGITEAVRTGTDAKLAEIVDQALILYLRTMYEEAEEAEDAGRGLGTVLVWLGLGAVPYLLRQGARDEAASLIDAVTDRDLSPETTHQALGHLRHILDDASRPDQHLVHEGLYAKVLSRIDPEEAGALLHDVIVAALSGDRYTLAWSAAGDLAALLRRTGNLADALSAADLRVELSRSAGFGPWTEAADACLRLEILDDMGEHARALGEATALLDQLETLPAESSRPEAVTSVSVREVALSTALGPATGLENWPLCLRLSRQIQDSHLRRGAPAHERARLRLNDAVPLMRLGRYGEAERTLLDCQTVFEAADDIGLLGAVFSARAELEDLRRRPDDAVTLAQAALRYLYRLPQPGALAQGHDALSRYLAQAGRRPQEAAAHRFAAVMLRNATEWASAGATIVDIGDLREFGAELLPATVDELITRVERVPEIRFGAALERLVPEPTEREAHFNACFPFAGPVVLQALEEWDQGRGALREALHRATDGERGESLFEGLDEVSTDLINMHLAQIDDEPSP
ncbi:hypothetical protein ACWF94_08770 [Streptomyces sp. NPDC055078]